MWQICYKISGDKAVSMEDKRAELSLAALEAVIAFEKQNNGSNGKFEDFWGTKGFDQYIKTVLWTRKAFLGNKMTKKKHLLNAISIDGSSARQDSSKVEIEDREDYFSQSAAHYIGSYLEDSVSLLAHNKIATSVLKLMLNDRTCLKDNGEINKEAIKKKLGINWKQIDKAIGLIDGVLHREF